MKNLVTAFLDSYIYSYIFIYLLVGWWQPKPGDAVERATAISGEKLLRNIMSDNKIELYAAYVSNMIYTYVCACVRACASCLHNDYTHM